VPGAAEPVDDGGLAPFAPPPLDPPLDAGTPPLDPPPPPLDPLLPPPLGPSAPASAAAPQIEDEGVVCTFAIVASLPIAAPASVAAACVSPCKWARKNAVA
jgi:hypothetical protein